MVGHRKSYPSPQTTGAWGEAQALKYLARQGYAIVATNYRTRYGEIDIIARKGAALVFIEVKCRRHAGFGSPLEAVDRRKQQRICRVAMKYLQFHRHGEGDIRFDVIAVQPHPQGKGEAVIEHVENAFDFFL